MFSRFKQKLTERFNQPTLYSTMFNRLKQRLTERFGQPTIHSTMFNRLKQRLTERFDQSTLSFSMISQLKQKLIEKLRPTPEKQDVKASRRPRSSHLPIDNPLKPYKIGARKRIQPLKTPGGGKKDLLDLDFNNHKEAFKSKYTSELVRAYIVYQMCSVNWVVKNNAKIMKKLRDMLGLRFFEFIMRLTLYGQFVAGRDQSHIKPMVERLRSFGVKSILDYSVEEDVSREEAVKREIKATTPKNYKLKGEYLKKFQPNERFADRRYKVSSVRTYFYENEATCEKNAATFLKSIEAVTEITHGKGCLALKLTSLGRPQLLLQLSEVIMRARKYMEQMDCKNGRNIAVMNEKKTVEDLKRYFGKNAALPEVKHFLDNITKDRVGVVHLFPWSDILDSDLKLSNEFRLPDPKTGQMRRLFSQISYHEEAMFRNMLRRLYKIVEAADAAHCRIMIDAEQSYFQPAISRICMELMKKYNKKQYLILNTYQAYMQCTYREMVTDLNQARRQNFFWGSKIVRGAYLEQERARAAYMGYPDPTCRSFEATTATFHQCLDEVITRAVNKERVCVMVASHNEDTVRYSIKQMRKTGLKPEAKVVCFGQLLGMCDHVTFLLGQSGFPAYKIVPYGPVVEVLPYLSRRANENRGFRSQVKKQKRLLLKEIFRRIYTKQLFYKPVGKYTPA